MIEEFIKEIEELKKYKKLYEYQKEDKKRMSQIIYNYMLKEYLNKPYEKRVEEHKKEICSNCRYNSDCEFDELEEEILKPISEEQDDSIPGRKCCKEFKWD